MQLTREQFARQVIVPAGPAGAIAPLVGSIAVLLLLTNLRTCWRSRELNPGVSFWQLFWGLRDAGDLDPVRLLLVGGPLLLVPVVLALVLADRAGRGARVDRHYRAYLRSGWTAVQIPTGVRVPVNRVRLPLVVLCGPQESPPAMAAAAARVGARVAAMDRQERREWESRLPTTVESGFRVGGLMPELPPSTLACTRRRRTDRVLVIGDGIVLRVRHRRGV
ncbi:hypothetical protein [Cellulomonas denverensis]|uniref:Uncharacterized protein n=1 Tax=Cellulomonas denverensis TaxID=264297 RepID=A0A7X6QZX0_9CELL|nr:hypothetical protein [Cellulomonas denverensis]NKY23575.1 hypothetical protein [Cellulomonas denverensis]GIG26824.1 hypothetical protein Cde04nite_30680 [Cellulomonas denverensis]